MKSSDDMRSKKENAKKEQHSAIELHNLSCKTLDLWLDVKNEKKFILFFNAATQDLSKAEKLIVIEGAAQLLLRAKIHKNPTWDKIFSKYTPRAGIRTYFPHKLLCNV